MIAERPQQGTQQGTTLPGPAGCEDNCLDPQHVHPVDGYERVPHRHPQFPDGDVRNYKYVDNCTYQKVYIVPVEEYWRLYSTDKEVSLGFRHQLWREGFRAYAVRYHRRNVGDGMFCAILVDVAYLFAYITMTL